MFRSPGLKRLYTVLLPVAGLLILFGIYSWLAKNLLPFAILMWCAALILLIVVGQLSRTFRARAQQLAAVKGRLAAGRIVVCRPLESADDLLRGYVISVDGKRAANLKFGEGVDVEASAGPHKLSAQHVGADVSAAEWEVTVPENAGVLVYVEPTFVAPALRRTSGEWLRFREP